MLGTVLSPELVVSYLSDLEATGEAHCTIQDTEARTLGFLARVM